MVNYENPVMLHLNMVFIVKLLYQQSAQRS